MFERFTSTARHVVVLAQEEARDLRHNYIGTEHLLLGLLGEPDEVAARALGRFGMSLAGAREELKAIIGPGKESMSGHIPFTPRAKKTLELALREALQLHHRYIGTEHILLGLIREGGGVAAQMMREHGDLLAIRIAVLDILPGGQPVSGRGWRRARRVGGSEAVEPGEPTEPEGQAELYATPAVDTSLSEAARLAGTGPVGSHHLLLAALADPDSAAARTLAALGVDLDGAKEALRSVDVTGTSDEPEEEAGRRQMLIRVAKDRLTIEAADAGLINLGRAALNTLGVRAREPDTISGDLAEAAGLSHVWLSIRDALQDINRRGGGAKLDSLLRQSAAAPPPTGDVPPPTGEQSKPEGAAD
jgi:ATP-dependent Clp protease ATP-binding subunit ClpA